MSDPTGPTQPPAPPPAAGGVPPQQVGYGAQPQYQAPKTNGLAVTSMILGILWVCWVGSLLAVIFGHVGLSQIKKSNGTQAGRGFAIAGLVLGYLGIAFLILALLFGEVNWSFNAG